jgi:L-serine dehydratase
VTYTSLFDLFTIGIGPSSSHTVGPMVAARLFAQRLPIARVARVEVELFGSLALTGRGHATPKAVLMGLSGFAPESVPAEVVADLEDAVVASHRLELDGRTEIAFDPVTDLILTNEFHPAHANVMRFTAFDHASSVLVEEHWASIGGGFVTEVGGTAQAATAADNAAAFAVRSGRDVLAICAEHDMTIAEVAMANECVVRSEAEVREHAAVLADVMFEVIARGMVSSGALPGGLNVKRRARDLSHELTSPSGRSLPPTGPSDWAGVWATAVGEENAAGHRIVTAPTNGAAGIVPAVLKFLAAHCDARCDDPVTEFLLTATMIGSLLKANAGISGAELGCQGEVGSACAMAAAGLAAALGGSAMQVENAAEIALEHHLGLTCDPLAGLVQVPCIERNALGAVKAVTAASLALRGDGTHFVGLDDCVETMRQTGRDMSEKYKETSTGGLAVNVVAC